MLEGNTFIDSIMDKLIESLMSVFKVIISFIFSQGWITFLFWVVIINSIAIFLMKRDKEYAKEEKRRIRESTLLSVALAGGAIGMYYAMYKYKHKTLHKKFTILIPFFIVLHFACISYMLVSSFI